MKTYENGIYYYTRESDAAEAVAIRPPLGYDGSKPCPVWLIIHGVGERSDGNLDNLRNVMTGFDYDGIGPRGREDAVLYPAFRAEADKRGHIIIVVTYKDNFNPNDIDYALNTAEADFNVDRTREAVIGFSWGGREVMRYLTSSPAAPRRLALAVICAPVNPGGNLQYVVDARLQLIGITYQEDPTVSPANVKAIITGINKLNPEIGAYYIELPGKAHGGLSEIQAGTYAIIPQHIMAYLDSVSTTNRKQYPTSTAKPTEPVTEKPGGTLIAKASFTGTGPDIALDGRQSTGWSSARWQVSQVPDGVNKYAAIVVEGAGWITGKAKLPKQGTYVIDLFVKDATGKEAKDSLTINYGAAQPVPKTVQAFNSATDLITYSDGSTENGRASYSFGKWVIEAASGKTYNT